jgi:hypothetical protein
VKRTWKKQACIKIIDPTLQELKNIMYDKDGPFGAGAEMWAMNMLQYITNKYPLVNVFWKYMEENWRHKTHMWVVGFQNLPYVATIESYHGTLKARLKLGKSRLVGHHVDSCIHELVGNVLTQYWYQNLCKNFAFVNNKHQQLFVVGALLGAQLILETNVTLLSYDGGPAHVMSCHVIKKSPFVIHHPQPNIKVGML